MLIFRGIDGRPYSGDRPGITTNKKVLAERESRGISESASIQATAWLIKIDQATAHLAWSFTFLPVHVATSKFTSIFISCMNITVLFPKMSFLFSSMLKEMNQICHRKACNAEIEVYITFSEDDDSIHLIFFKK